ncbi:MAG: hypothetical protein HFF58_04830 [Lawsonibacter sp.]|nr:hypothetical protein [Lawsonibacter sp.]
MVYGAILEKGEHSYTYLKKVFQAIGGAQKNYNWLISDADCFPTTPEFSKLLGQKSCWLTGEALTAMVEQEDFLWIWGVLSGFPKSVPEEQVRQYPLPYADGYQNFWHNPLTLQHPLAEIEIVPWDSSLTLLLSKQKEIVEDFRAFFPLSEDLIQKIEALNDQAERKAGTLLC